MAPPSPQPASPVPPSWPVGDAYLRQSEAALPTLTYRDIFRDARLQKLIAQALVENRDLRLAAANIRAAREQYRIQRAERFPEIPRIALTATADDATRREMVERLPGSVVGVFAAREIDGAGANRALRHAAVGGLVGILCNDKTTAIFAAQAVCAALYARERNGRGQHIQLAMLDAMERLDVELARGWFGASW